MDTRALGALCWALGLDNRLFTVANTQVGTGEWLAWHFCALVSRWDDPDIEAFARRGLNAALAVVGNADLDIEVRFWARVQAAVAARLCMSPQF